ncbi:MAG: hypothetical protein ACQEXJ_14375 [Myxococcota bacterium]
MNPIGEKFVEETLETALEVDPSSIRQLVDRVRRKAGGPDEVLADAIVEFYARKGALVGFLTGLPGSPLLALPLAFVDTRGTLRLAADIVAAVEYLRRPDFFDDPGWRTELARILGDLEGELRPGERTRKGSLRHAARVMLQRVTTGESSRLLRQAILHWASKRTARRAVFTKLVPVVGGFAGAAWNYVELRHEGREVVSRILAETSHAHAPAPTPAAERKPAAERPAKRKPAAEKRVAEEPQPEPPAVDKPAAEKPAKRKPAVDKPARKATRAAAPSTKAADKATGTAALSKLTRKELYERAQKAKIPGRSGMSKKQLVDALSDKGS